MKLGIVLFCAAGAYAVQGGQASRPDVQEIVRRSVAATMEDWKAAPNFAFIERDVESKKDRNRTVKTYEVLMIEGSPYNKLIAINDRPLSKEEAEEEDAKVQQEVRRRESESKRDRARRIAKYQKERTQDNAMLREMVGAFEFRLAGETKRNGRDCWVLEATPKPGYEPRTREGKVLAGMRGRMWVDKEEYQWVRVEAQVTRPVSLYGFFAKVGPGTRFELEQEPVSANVWMPKHFAVRVNASALGFINENSTDDETYRNYRPMTKALELQAMNGR